MIRKRPSRLGAIALLAASAVAVVIAASRTHGERAPEASSGAAQPATSGAAPGLDAVPSPAPSASVEPPPGPLDHARRALGDLGRKTRQAHVRVAFFGDSHAQGELWTGGLRARLQKRFGDGGPGFVAAGSPKHRNDALKIQLTGAFHVSPRDPATIERVGDGRLGLGGLLAFPERATGRVVITPLAVGALVWDVCTLHVDPKGVVRATGAAASPVEIRGEAGALKHTLVHAGAPGGLVLDVEATSLCGVVGERPSGEGLGVVLDALGINGARFATALAWDEETFVAELARRDPDLVILEYGTNEESDIPPRLDDDAKSVESLIARVRRAAPEASCMVLGPTERRDRIDIAPLLRDTFRDAAERAGCAFWDTYEKMGGHGSIHAWQDAKPTLAQRDGIHLTADGYEKLAEMLYEDLVRGVE